MKEVAMPNGDKRDKKLLLNQELVFCISSEFDPKEPKTTVSNGKETRRVSSRDLRPCKILICVSDFEIAETVQQILEIVNVEISICSSPDKVLGDGFFGVVTDCPDFANKAVVSGKPRVALVTSSEKCTTEEISLINPDSIDVLSFEKWLKGKPKPVDCESIMREEGRRLR